MHCLKLKMVNWKKLNNETRNINGILKICGTNITVTSNLINGTSIVLAEIVGDNIFWECQKRRTMVETRYTGKDI